MLNARRRNTAMLNGARGAWQGRANIAVHSHAEPRATATRNILVETFGAQKVAAAEKRIMEVTAQEQLSEAVFQQRVSELLQTEAHLERRRQILAKKA